MLFIKLGMLPTSGLSNQFVQVGSVGAVITLDHLFFVVAAAVDVLEKVIFNRALDQFIFKVRRFYDILVVFDEC